MSEQARGYRKRLQGVVKSDKMDKTVTVTVERLVKHPRFKKYVRRKNTFMAHDPQQTAREGDVVEIESTRPLSRHKRWRLVRVLGRGLASRAGIRPSEEAQKTDTDLTA
ncbi:MAG: 30S ribosomal protein S17 [Candidatus Brocadiaceae bacterium]|nr:30S ribosomal protein S17 [Candidatus Brocadiaceae bacterium]